jgi:hypothetical protein
MKKFALLFLVIATSLSAYSQARHYDKKKSEFFPRFGDYGRKGWYIMPGVTNTQGFGSTERSTIGADSLMIYRYKPTGLIGGFIQVGRFHAPKRGIVSYFDYGLDFRILSGRHNYSAHFTNEAEAFEIMAHEGSGRFSEGWLGLNVNASRISSVSNKIFLVNSLGINANARVLSNAVYSPNPLGLGADVPSIISAQLHYQFGVGIKMGRGLYIIPTFETPILGIWDFNSGIPSLRYFNTYNQPLLLGVKFMWLTRNKPDKCPTSKGTGKKGKSSKESLFEPKVHKKYKW